MLRRLPKPSALWQHSKVEISSRRRSCASDGFVSEGFCHPSYGLLRVVTRRCWRHCLDGSCCTFVARASSRSMCKCLHIYLRCMRMSLHYCTHTQYVILQVDLKDVGHTFKLHLLIPNESLAPFVPLMFWEPDSFHPLPGGYPSQQQPQWQTVRKRHRS